MRSCLDKAHEILENAARALRDLIKEELIDGRFSEVARVAQLADSVRRLSALAPPRGIEDTSISETNGSANGNRLEPDLSIASVRRAGTRSGRTKAAMHYPRFEREASRLVKIGWSKRDGRPYEHKAPREVINLVERAVLREAKDNGDFVIDEIMPVKGADALEVPSYQVYLVIAWLRDLGFVERRGKVGYRVNRQLLTKPRVEAAWASLTSRRRG